MLAIGIDVSKSKSAAAILNQDGSVHTEPFELHHDKPEMDALIKFINNQNKIDKARTQPGFGSIHYHSVKIILIDKFTGLRIKRQFAVIIDPENINQDITRQIVT